MRGKAVPIRRAYALTKCLMESEALDLKRRNPYLHLADACTEVLRRRPTYWLVYRAAMAPDVRMPSEFQLPARRRAVPRPRDVAWQMIEDLARTIVTASMTPITLRDAVGRVVAANPQLYRDYIDAKRRR